MLDDDPIFWCHRRVEIGWINFKIVASYITRDENVRNKFVEEGKKKFDL